MPFGKITKSLIKRGMKPAARAFWKGEKKKTTQIVKRAIMKMSEQKWYGIGKTYTDIYATDSMSTSEGFLYQNVFTPTQAVGDSSRVGDKARITSMHIMGTFRQTVGDGTATHNIVRLLVFQKHTPSSTAPGGTEIFNTNTISGGIVSTYSHRNVDFQSLYTILLDKKFVLSNNNAAATSASNPMNIAKYFEYWVPLKYCKKDIKFSNAGQTDMDHPIYVAAIGDLADDPSGNPQVAWQVRFRFTDL